MNVLSIVEIVILIAVFVWIYILYKNQKHKSMVVARITLIVMAIIIVITQFYLHRKMLLSNSNNIVQASKIDTEAPVITLNGDEEVVLKPNTKYTEPGYIATDDQDGDITNKVEITREKISDRHYAVHYEVIDSAGNKSQIVTRKVTVEEVKEEPQVQETKNTENKNKAGVIYLTFDDGPSLDITPKILDILKEENVKATFFVINYGENKENLIKRIVQEGHTIGIHGYSHEYKEIYVSDEAFMNNIKKLQEKIKNTTGINTKYTRFPGGSSNTISRKYSPGIMTRLTQKVIEQGYKYYDWNVSVEDAGSSKTTQEVYNRYVKELVHSRANIVLMHDFGGNEKTLNALRDMIAYGKENGYTFEKIDDNTPMITHGVNN